MIEIIKAYWEWLFYPQTEEAKRRYNICKKCAKKKFGVCTDCGCVCVVKAGCKICECEVWLHTK